MNRLACLRVALVVAALPVAAACNSSQLAARPPALDITPSPLSFGKVLAGTTTSGTLTLHNTGGKPITIGSWAFSPAEPRFEVVGVSPAVVPPFTMQPDEEIAVEIRFQPPAPGKALSDFVVTTDLPGAPDTSATVSGTGYLNQNDTTEQGTQQSADILFVVDNSGSMGDKQTKLANSFNTFITWLIGHTVSFHIGITTTDMDAGGEQGAFVGNPKILKNETPNLVSAFDANVHVGTSGSATEKGLDGAVSALTYPLIAGANGGFLRDNATLYVVFVSDEDDQSSQSVGYYVDLLTAVKDADPTKIYFSAIAGPPPSGCSATGGSAVEAPRYYDVVQETAGLWGSICDDDFGVTLQNLAFAITAPVAEFHLAYVPDPATIKVYVDGALEPSSHWTYQPTPNSVLFGAAFVPAMGAQVEIHYDAIDTP